MKITNFAAPSEPISMVQYRRLMLGEDRGINYKVIYFSNKYNDVYQGGLVSNFNPNRVVPRRPKRETPNIKDKE